MAKTRNSNIELLRFIAMLSIITLHFLSHGGVLDSLERGSIYYYLAYFIRFITALATNTYVLISGYFLSDSNFKFSRPIKIAVQMIFYSVLIYLALCLFGFLDFEFIEFITSGLPFLSRDWWFASVFLGLSLISPFLNILVNAMNKKQHIFLVVFLLLLISVPHMSYVFSLGAGTGLVWFVVLYFTGAFIKKYPEVFSNIKIFVAILVSYLVFVVGVLVAVNVLHINKISLNNFYDNNSIFVYLASVSVFVIFTFLKIKNEILSKVINLFASVSFGVYLIHDNVYIRELIIWDKLINAPKLFDSAIGILVSLCLLFASYLVCGIIEWIRSWLFDLTRINLLISKIDNIKFIKKLSSYLQIKLEN